MRQYPAWCIKTSVWLNEVTGGPKGWPFCSRIWQGRLEGDPKYVILAAITDKVFEVLFDDPGHTRNSWLKTRKIK